MSSAFIFFCILAVVLAGMLLLGQWIAFALGTAGSLVLFLSKGDLGLSVISSVVWNSSNSYILIAIPLFLLMGEIILHCGAGARFYTSIVALMGKSRGSLLHANTISCAVFSAVSGSSVATAATIGTVAIPEMLKRGYQPQIVFGSLAAGGTLGILIPPSIVMVLYGSLVQESISKLFMAGIIPGMVLASLFLLYGVFRVYFNPNLVPKPKTQSDESLFNDRYVEIIHILPVIALLVSILGSIYTGIATPTEAAALGAVGALLLAACYRTLTCKIFATSVMATVRTTCMISMIIIGAQILSTALTLSGSSRELTEWMLSLGLSKWTFLVFLVVLYVVLGMFVDGVSMIYITLPVLFPPVKAMGFDPIWFGVFLTVLIELGQITPPVGLNLFTIHSISEDHSFAEVVAGSTPYAGLVLLLLLILSIWPGLATWLPSILLNP